LPFFAWIAWISIELLDLQNLDFSVGPGLATGLRLVGEDLLMAISERKAIKAFWQNLLDHHNELEGEPRKYWHRSPASAITRQQMKQTAEIYWSGVLETTSFWRGVWKPRYYVMARQNYRGDLPSPSPGEVTKSAAQST